MGKCRNIFGQTIEFECMGCDIAKHKLIPPGGYVYDDGFINVSADPEIPIKGFVVLGVSKHVKSICDFTSQERVQIMDILNRTILAIKKIGLTEEVLIVQEETAKHFHIWIVPTYSWMDIYGKNIRSIKEIIAYSKTFVNEDYLKELLEIIEKLKKEFQKEN